MTQVIQRLSVYYSGQLNILKYLLSQVCGSIDPVDEKKFRVFKNIDITVEGKVITLEVSF